MLARLASFPLIAAGLLVAGCSGVEPLGSGTLAIQWQVSPSGCAEAGVDVVEVRATGPHAIVERFACSRGGVELVDLTPGTYRVELHGFDANGDEIFVSDPIGQDVEADQVTTTPTMRLLASPANVDVRWAFDNGRVCGANDVRWISIGAFDEFDYEVATARFACDSGEGRVPALRAGAYLFEVNGIDADTTIRWRGTAPVKVGRGEDVIIDVDLSPAR